MHTSYININGSTSFCYYNHQDPNFKPENMHSTMENCSYKNGKFAGDDGVDRINSPVILESKCLTSKRSCKKDRHSKINTARGPRDRRMRLSLEVAKKFFSLQDMLGFDKASSTIEWLMMKSKGAIQQLNQSCSLMGVSIHSPSSASEGEVLSGVDEKTGDDHSMIVRDKDILDCGSGNKEKKNKKKTQRVLRRTVYVDHSLAKETREKARARARKRTREKRNIIKLAGYDGAGCHQYSKLRPILDQEIDQNTNRLGSWIPFGETQVQLTDQAEYPSSHFQFKQGIVGDSNWSPSFLINYQHTAGVSHEHQFSDLLQILGKPWEGINN